MHFELRCWVVFIFKQTNQQTSEDQNRKENERVPAALKQLHDSPCWRAEHG